MKQNMMFTDYSEGSEKSTVSIASLDRLQHGVLIGLGSVLTYVVLTFSTREPFFDMATSGAIFLWLMLLVAPAVAGLVVYKFPSWQSVPLTVRKNAILQSFGLSLFTLSTTIAYFLKWNPYQPGNWLMCAFITFCYGAILVRLSFHLGRQVQREEGELFP